MSNKSKQSPKASLRKKRSATSLPKDYLSDIKRPDELTSSQKHWLFRSGNLRLISADTKWTNQELKSAMSQIKFDSAELMPYLVKAPAYAERLLRDGHKELALGILHQAMQAEYRLKLDVASHLPKTTTKMEWTSNVLFQIFDLTEDISSQATKIINSKGVYTPPTYFQTAVHDCLGDFINHVPPSQIDPEVRLAIVKYFTDWTAPPSITDFEKAQAWRAQTFKEAGANKDLWTQRYIWKHKVVRTTVWGDSITRLSQDRGCHIIKEYDFLNYNKQVLEEALEFEDIRDELDSEFILELIERVLSGGKKINKKITDEELELITRMIKSVKRANLLFTNPDDFVTRNYQISSQRAWKMMKRKLDKQLGQKGLRRKKYPVESKAYLLIAELNNKPDWFMNIPKRSLEY